MVFVARLCHCCSRSSSWRRCSNRDETFITQTNPSRQPKYPRAREAASRAKPCQSMYLESGVWSLADYWRRKALLALPLFLSKASRHSSSAPEVAEQ